MVLWEVHICYEQNVLKTEYPLNNGPGKLICYISIRKEDIQLDNWLKYFSLKLFPMIS